MDPLAILAAMLHVQSGQRLPLRNCVVLADGILEGTDVEVTLYRAQVEAEEKAKQPPAPVTNKVM